MNFGPPSWVKEAADEALNTVVANHYSHPKGRVRLRQALKNHYSPLLGRELDIESEILVTSGANEGKGIHGSCEISIIYFDQGQYSVFTAFIEPGDEVIMFEPFFDQYLPSVVFQGGTPVYVPLHPMTGKENPTSNDWIIDFDELRCVHS